MKSFSILIGLCVLFAVIDCASIFKAELSPNSEVVEEIRERRKADEETYVTGDDDQINDDYNYDTGEDEPEENDDNVSEENVQPGRVPASDGNQQGSKIPMTDQKDKMDESADDDEEISTNSEEENQEKTNKEEENQEEENQEKENQKEEQQEEEQQEGENQEEGDTEQEEDESGRPDKRDEVVTKDKTKPMSPPTVENDSLTDENLDLAEAEVSRAAASGNARQQQPPKQGATKPLPNRSNSGPGPANGGIRKPNNSNNKPLRNGAGTEIRNGKNLGRTNQGTALRNGRRAGSSGGARVNSKPAPAAGNANARSRNTGRRQAVRAGPAVQRGIQRPALNRRRAG